MASTGEPPLLSFLEFGHCFVSFSPRTLLFFHAITKVSSAGLVGNVNSLEGSSMVGWIRLYNLTFLVGVAISFVVFFVLNYIWPPVGLGEDRPFIDDEVLYGVAEEHMAGSNDGLEKHNDKD